MIKQQQQLINNPTSLHHFKIHHSAIYALLLPFSILNYDPAQADELYDVWIRRVIPHISK